MRVFTVLMFAVLLLIGAPQPAEAQLTSPLGVLSAQTGVNVSETRWAGSASWYDGETKQWTMYFRPDGVLEYSYDGATFDNGRWVQNDTLVTFHTNTYFALYSGIVDAQSFRGTMHNRRGATGVFVFTRR